MTTAAQNSKQILAQKGTAATPSFSFLGGNATGMYLAGTNQLGFSTAGVNAVTIDASQNVTITGSFITPTIAGGTTASSTLTLESTTGAGTSDSILLKTGSQQTRMSIDTSGNVGIATGNLTFSGTGQRITGDFTNSTVSNRLAFQSSTTNGQTIPIAFPNGTSGVSGFAANSSSSDPANASEMIAAVVGASDVRFSSAIRGTGTYLPMTFYTGGSEAMRIGATAGTDKGTVGIGYSTLTGVGVNGLAVAGNVGIGTSSPGNKLTVFGGSIQQYRATGDNSLVVQTGDTSNNYTRYYNTSGITDVGQSNGNGFIAVNGAQPFVISVNSSERMRIDSSGNVGIGYSGSALNKLLVYSNSGLMVAPDADNSSNGLGVGVLGNSIATTTAGSAKFWMSGNNAAHSGNIDLRSGSAVDTTFNMYNTSGTKTVYLSTGGNSYINSGSVGIGTSSPSASTKLTLTGTSTNAGLLVINSTAAANTGFFGSVAAILGSGTSNDLAIGAFGSSNMTFYTNANERMRIDASGNVIAGGSVALATTATNGFLYVPTCAGTPTGTPTAVTGMVPIVVNTTNNKLYFYSGGAWRDAGP